MIDEMLRKDKDFEILLTKIAQLTLKEDTREYLKSTLATCYENRKQSENDVIKYSIKVLISLFIYIVLVNTTIDSISIDFVSIKDLSLIKTFFPIVILYYALIMSATDLFRLQNTIMYYNIQSVLYPDIIEHNLSKLFVPFSLINLLSSSPSTNKLVRLTTNISYRVIFGLITFSGFFVFAYSLNYGIERALGKNILFLVSIFMQFSLSLITVSVFIRKLRIWSSMSINTK